MSIKPAMIISICAATLTLGACDEMTRFKQEKYECGLNNAGVYEVLLRSMKVGDDATVSTNRGEEIVPIIFSDDSAFILERDGMILRISRETGNIKVTKGTTYRNLRCKKSIFKM